MILLDFSQIIISNYMAQMKRDGSSDDHVDENKLRHSSLNTIRMYNSMFRSTYGQMVVCIDSQTCWRKDVFPHYKANRKKNREKSSADWNHIYSCLNTIRDEIKENFPFRVIHVDGAEADDIIGTLVAAYAGSQPIMIVSSDGDFIQLQRFPNVRQYSPTLKKFLECEDPGLALKEKIIRGDDGDGIPNVLSEDDIFLQDKKQKSIYKKVLPEWLTKELSEFDEEFRRNFQRNERLIDLSMVPHEIQERILEAFKEPVSRPNVYSYLVKHRLATLLETLPDFIAGE